MEIGGACHIFCHSGHPTPPPAPRLISVTGCTGRPINKGFGPCNGLPRSEPFNPSNVLILSAEDGLADTIRPRVDAMGGDPAWLYAYDGALVFDPGRLAALEATVKKVRPRLVIVDPLVAYTGPRVDLHRANGVRAILAALAGISERYDAAILAIRHLSKTNGRKSIHRGLASIDFTAAARSVLLAGHDVDDPGKKAMVQIKNNLAPLGKAIGYTLAGGSFQWVGDSDLTADRILAAEGTGEKRSAVKEAEGFLRELLSEGPRPAKKVFREAEAQGISVMAVKRAKKAAGVKKRRQGFGPGARWLWVLGEPHRGSNSPIEDQENNKSPYGEGEPLCREEKSAGSSLEEVRL